MSGKLRPKTFTLDGEVAVFDAELVSRFEWLRHLNHGDLATPPLFIAFDLLSLGEKDFRTEPLRVRRKELERLVPNASVSMSRLRQGSPRKIPTFCLTGSLTHRASDPPGTVPTSA